MDDGLQQNVIFCDEMGCNVWTARSQGRSRRGDRSVIQVAGQRGQNLTACIAISSRLGFIHCKFIRGGMTKELFSDFCSEVSVLVAENFILICDNATSHKNPSSMDNGEVRFLPPYSPFLNPTERAISCLKASLKRKITEPDIQRQFANREAARRNNIPLQEHRLRILQEKIEESTIEITEEKCRQWNHASIQYLSRCIRLEDILH